MKWCEQGLCVCVSSGKQILAHYKWSVPVLMGLYILFTFVFEECRKLVCSDFLGIGQAMAW
jgi:hypothetical protein